MIALLILVTLLVPPLLAYLGFISLIVMFIADVAILLVAAWGLDRKRAPGAGDPFKDANRPDFPSSFTAFVPPIPSEAFEVPKDWPDADGPRDSVDPAP